MARTVHESVQCWLLTGTSQSAFVTSPIHGWVALILYLEFTHLAAKLNPAKPLCWKTLVSPHLRVYVCVCIKMGRVSKNKSFPRSSLHPLGSGYDELSDSMAHFWCKSRDRSASFPALRHACAPHTDIAILKDWPLWPYSPPGQTQSSLPALATRPAQRSCSRWLRSTRARCTSSSWCRLTGTGTMRPSSRFGAWRAGLTSLSRMLVREQAPVVRGSVG
jgi:hypothetical protein